MTENPYESPRVSSDYVVKRWPIYLEPKMAFHFWVFLFLAFNVLCVFGPKENTLVSDLWPMVLIAILSAEVLVLSMTRLNWIVKLILAVLSVVVHIFTGSIIGIVLILLGPHP